MPGSIAVRKSEATSADNISPIVSTASSVFKHCLFGCKTKEELEALHNDLLHHDSGQAIAVEPCGLTPMHAAAFLGHVECCQALLSITGSVSGEDQLFDPSAVLNARSLDGLGPYRRVRGGKSQAKKLRLLRYEGVPDLPLFSFAGRTPLMLAVQGCQLEAVHWLLSQPGCDPDLTDCDGMTAFRLAIEGSALSQPQSDASSSWSSIITALLTHIEDQEGAGDKEVEGGKSSAPRDKAVGADVARMGVRKREIALIARVQATECARREVATREGLQRIAKLYRPLHPAVYSVRPVEASASSSGMDAAVDLLLVSSRSVDGSPPLVLEPAEGVLVFQLMSASFASAVWEEMAHYVDQAEQQGLPLHKRYDHNNSMLEACGFLPLMDALNDSIQPLLPRIGLDSTRTRAAHAVRLNNFHGNEETAKLALKVHQDKYKLTLNVCLHTSEDLEGSTVSFFQSAEDSSKSRTLKPGSVYLPEEADIVYKHEHKVGFAVLHSAKSWHKTDPILAGERGSLILWSE